MPSRPARRRRAPRGSLNRDSVVRAALELARGPDAPPLTIQRVAEALNTRPMSLYTHIQSRDDLLNAVTELALAEWVVDVPDDADWATRIRCWCHSLRDQLLRHPSLIWDITRGRRFQPIMIEKVVIVSQALREAGAVGDDHAQLLRWVPQNALGAIVLELTRPTDLQTGDDEATAVHASLGAVPAAVRDEFRDILGHVSTKGTDDLFAFSVDRIIDGVRAVVDRSPSRKETP